MDSVTDERRRRSRWSAAQGGGGVLHATLLHELEDTANPNRWARAKNFREPNGGSGFKLVVLAKSVRAIMLERPRQ